MGICENGLGLVGCSQIQRNQTCHPAVTEHDIRRPAEFFHRFDSSLAEEGHALGIVFKRFAVFVFKYLFAFEELLVVEEIDLQARIGQRGDFDEQRIIVVINDDTCIGCGTCANSCPYDNIRLVEIADRAGRAIVDDDGTGTITLRNLRRVTKELGETMTDEELQEMIERADSNGDNAVSPDDFYNIMTKKTFT